MSDFNRFDIYRIIDRLRNKRPVFCSEADFQHEFAIAIREEYPQYKVRLEYCAYEDSNKRLDILIITDNNKWIPIELKYKTKGGVIPYDGEDFKLKNQLAKDTSCYSYLHDISRIESLTENPKFICGYAIFLTNDSAYMRKPQKAECIYNEFSLEEGITKCGVMTWSENASAGTVAGYNDPICLRNKYIMNLVDYSSLGDKNNQRFIILVNKIDGTS